jgi:hypothetical protein
MVVSFRWFGSAKLAWLIGRLSACGDFASTSRYISAVGTGELTTHHLAGELAANCGELAN